jgi:hypothetical protein
VTETAWQRKSLTIIRRVCRVLAERLYVRVRVPRLSHKNIVTRFRISKQSVSQLHDVSQ